MPLQASSLVYVSCARTQSQLALALPRAPVTATTCPRSRTAVPQQAPTITFLPLADIKLTLVGMICFDGLPPPPSLTPPPPSRGIPNGTFMLVCDELKSA
jgi:hypothetical protein